MGATDILFGKDKYKVRNISDPLSGALDKIAGERLNKFQARSDLAQDRYAKEIGMSTDKLHALAPSSERAYGTALSEATRFDPLADYERVRSGNLAALQQSNAALAQANEGARKRAQRSSGYAGIPASAYTDALLGKSVNSAIAPLYNTVFQNLGADSRGITSGRLQKPGLLDQLVRGREGVYTRIPEQSILPALQSLALLQGEAGVGGQLADAIKKNYAGMEQQHTGGIFDTLTGITGAVGQAAGDIAGAYGNIMTGGMLGGAGGMLGGMMGGGGGPGGGGGWQNPNAGKFFDAAAAGGGAPYGGAGGNMGPGGQYGPQMGGFPSMGFGYPQPGWGGQMPQQQGMLGGLFGRQADPYMNQPAQQGAFNRMFFGPQQYQAPYGGMPVGQPVGF